ncbi:MAG TPA: protein translocase subunit SecD [Nannocystaceae bacterium]|nr:protein translocase subunit SecD [Nannocystaceae bacterium]
MRRFLKLKALALLALVTWATLMILPSLVPQPEENLPAWITQNFQRKFQLGLDLQGGLHLEYSVAVDEAIENKLDQIAAELEIAFREKKDLEVAVTRIDSDKLQIQFPTPDDVALATDDVMAITVGVLDRIEPDAGEPGVAQGVILLQMPEEAISENRKAAVANALETVRKRVDAMGVAEPNIYPKNRQIVVELPGLATEGTELRAAASDASALLTQILAASGTAQITTSEVRDDPGAVKLTVPEGDARALLQRAFPDKITDDGIIVDDRLPVELVVRPEDPAAPDPATVVLALSERARDQVLEQASDFRRLLKIIERQAVLRMHLVDDETPFKDGKPYLRALYEAGLVTEGMGISVNVESDYGREGGVTVKQPFAYYARDLQTLESFFAGLPPEWRLPPDMKIAYGPVPWQTRRNSEAETLYRTYVIKSRAEVTGDRIVNATVGFDQQTGTPEVNVKLDRVGADLFEEMSGANVGRKMAIILDELVRSDPIFNERIPGGNVRITLGSTPGQSSREAANDLTKVLKSGSLPARLQKESEMRVGADLGLDAVESGAKAFLIGLVSVVAFMAVYYRKGGMVANAALVMNVVFMLAAMAFFRATLTLPGIAGIVLTLGMAVDANVIIYERMRDYLREGYTARAAIEAGYDRAFTTILDSQLTTAIAGLVLWQYGSGPIRGFAVTLLIGIATSIFTGVFCTRLFFDFQANRRGFDKVSI